MNTADDSADLTAVFTNEDLQSLQATVERFLQVQAFPTYKLVDRDGAVHMRYLARAKRGHRSVVYDFENEAKKPTKRKHR